MANYEPIVEEEMENIGIPIATIGNYSYPITPTSVIQGVLPVQKGGTGIKSLSGGNRIMISNVDGTLMEESDFPLSRIDEKEVALKNLIKKNRFYEVNVPTTGWVANSLSGDGYMQTLSVPGLTINDNPIIGLLSNATSVAVRTAELKAFSCISNIITSNNAITIICFNSIPTTAITIGINCISPNDD